MENAIPSLYPKLTGTVGQSASLTGTVGQSASSGERQSCVARSAGLPLQPAVGRLLALRGS